MWYSATKVGIMEIDMDHSNVDTMLQLYFQGQAPENFLGEIINGLIRHFKHEEEVIARFGHVFPEDHVCEHERLVDVLQGKVLGWKEGTIDGKDLAEEIRGILLLHVAEYDVKLKNYKNFPEI